MHEKFDLDIKQSNYDWCVRAFSFLEGRLGLNIKFHQERAKSKAARFSFSIILRASKRLSRST